MKKTISLLSLLFVLHFPFISCSDGECGEGFDYNMKIEKFKAIVGNYNPERFTTGEIPPYRKLAIRLTVSEASQIPEKQSFSFGIIPGSFACSPVPPKFTRKITAVKMFSNKKISNYGEGDDISSLFGVAKYGYKLAEIDKYLVKNEGIFQYQGDEIFFQLLKAPSEFINNHDITIELKMDDGEVYKVVAKGFSVEVNSSTKS